LRTPFLQGTIDGMSLFRTAYALTQGAYNSAKWGAKDERLEGEIWPNVLHGNFGMASQIAFQGILKAIYKKNPNWLDFKHIAKRVINPELDLVAISGEATVIREGDQVKKYLTGKSQEPHALCVELIVRHAAVQKLGKYFPKTAVSVERPKLFKNKNFEVIDTEFVTITQDFIDIEYADPHLNQKLLDENPEILQALGGLAEDLMDTFEQTGYLMDFVLSENIVWGKGPEDSENRLYIIDTVPTHINDNHIVGLPAPLWNTERYVENFMEFVSIVRPDENFDIDC